MTNRKYSAIVFDLGQVIVPFNYQPFIDKINQIQNGLGNQFVEKYNTNYTIHREFEKGKISENDFISKMLEYLDYKIDGETFCTYWSDIFSLDKDVISLLPFLKQKYKLYLVSNTNSIHKKYGYQNYEFLELFDKLFLSHEVGFIKPEKEIYQAVEKESGFPSGEHIFIDDILEYVDAAKQLGWDGIQFKGNEDLVNNFKKRNIL
jgi:putative hydrolase of the HAD superfamily